ncbi:hypothetical protein THAOC_37326 [Thalassiosira oceanica]|uniref:Uncharacterized protein n=1 Tax=Thalassiosira oceanica TaxID=159749 RepID=K0R6E4_THAOC|nr:hypothetical protein THAOC_37326 [Thalassiosira oceanica]|eukprot:EJK44161.1 hypothetical protein THAOC_37326 [Thalassiosira oceanica]
MRPNLSAYVLSSTGTDNRCPYSTEPNEDHVVGCDGGTAAKRDRGQGGGLAGRDTDHEAPKTAGAFGPWCVGGCSGNHGTFGVKPPPRKGNRYTLAPSGKKVKRDTVNSRPGAR